LSLMAFNINGQDYPWPDLGEAMIIEPGAPGVINETINNDTLADGSRAHNHYILRRGATYLYTFTINNVGWPLMVTAEEGDGPKPIIRALGPPAGENEAERAFLCQGNTYLKDLHIIGWDMTPYPTDNATIRLGADSITVVNLNCFLEFNRQNIWRINNNDGILYIENCVVYNQGQAHDIPNGQPLNWRGSYSPLVHFRNNTVVNCTQGLNYQYGDKESGKTIIDHNTLVNFGYQGGDFGRHDTVIFTNNLCVNVGILGDAWNGDRSRFAEGWFLFAIDTAWSEVITDEDTAYEYKEPVLQWENNHYYTDPAVAAFLPDSTNKASLIMFDEQLTDLIGENNEVVDEGFSFTDFPVMVEMYQDFIEDYYNIVDVPSQLPGFDWQWFDRDFDLDFSYSESHPAYSAAADGGPLGDRNWFPDWTPLSVEEIETTHFKVYPNPASNFIHISLDEGQSINRIVISNILGQEMKSVNDITDKALTISTSGLVQGVYFVNYYNNKHYIGTNKLLIK